MTAPPVLKDKVYLVTGSTEGIGEHTAKKLAACGATVLVHGRSIEKAQKAAERVKAAAGSSTAEVRAFAADLSSLDQVKKLAADVHQAVPGVTVLVNNAGIFGGRERQVSVDGFEMTWAVNVLAPFLLTGLLLDRVSERIVTVSSVSAAPSLDFDNWNQKAHQLSPYSSLERVWSKFVAAFSPAGVLPPERSYSPHDAYAQSKLAEQMMTVELAERLGDCGIVTNCLDPGDVNTKLLEAGWGMCGIPLEQANDAFMVSADPALGKVTGKYFLGMRDTRMPRDATEAGPRQRLWQMLEQQTGFRYPQRPSPAMTSEVV